MTTSFIGPGEDMVEAVARLLEAPGAPADPTVVFPGRRPAHFLRRRLARGRQAAFIPPRVVSMDELVDGVVSAQDARAGRVRPGLDSIDAVAILYEIQTASPMGGAAFMTLDSFFPVGMKLWADIEELLIECVPAASVRDFQAVVQEEVPAGARGRLQELATFYERFYQEADRRGFSTRASRFRQAAETLDQRDVEGTGPLILAGFSQLTAAEKAIVRTLAGWDRVHMLFQEGPGLVAWLKDLPVALPRDARPTPPLPHATFTTATDTHGQVFALNAALGEPDESTLIVLPRADTLFPLLRHVLSRWEESLYNVSLPYPLERTPLYGFLDSLMELVGSMEGEMVYLPAYTAFVLHPYVKNLRRGASAEDTRVLFHTLEDRLAEMPTRRFALLEELENDTKIFERAARGLDSGTADATMAASLRAHLQEIHRRTIGSFRSFGTVGEFAARCRQLITWVHDQSTARAHPTFTEFAETFVEALTIIGRSLMAEKSFNDTASYFALLRRFLRIRQHHFHGTPLAGLQVLGVQETRTIAFSRVFVLDANEGVFPDTGADGTLLPHPVRAALHLPTARDREALAAYHFSLLAAGAKEMHLFSVVSGDQERSRFVERLLWEQEKARGPAAPAAETARAVQYTVTLAAARPPAVPKTGEVAQWLSGRRFSPTGLSTYLQCPLRFYYREVLQLAERTEPGADVDQSQVGIFVHAVLQRFFASRRDKRLVDADLSVAAMGAVVDELFLERFGQAEDGSARLLRDQVKKHMADFLEDYLAPLASRHSVVVRDVEKDLQTEWKGFRLRGRVDAVQTRDGMPVLVDYKTSASAQHYAIKWKKLDPGNRATWAGAIPSLQLPVYLLLYAPEAGLAPQEMQAMFLLLGRMRVDEHIEVPLFDAVRAPGDAWSGLEAVLLGLLEEIVSPGVAFAPAEDLAAACAFCPYTGICGTGAYRRP